MENNNVKTIRDFIEREKKSYASIESTVIPALHEAEGVYGWISPEAIEDISNYTGVSKAKIKGTATFYAMYKNKPMGRHLIQLCTNVVCMVMGSESLLSLLNERYELEPGGMTSDGRFSLVIMECIGACGTAPAMLVDADYYDNLNEKNIFEILDKYQ